MAVRRIRIYGDPVLHRKAARVREIDRDLRRLLDDMAETMLDAPGLGLAAPQVGESVRAIVVCDSAGEDEQRVCQIINPRVRSTEGEQRGMEGCLSLPTLHAEVTRPMKVVVTGIGPEGEEVRVEGEGLLARALLHEIDHLEGVVFSERADRDTLAWMVPDQEEEGGYRLKPTTMEDVEKAFERMRRRQEEREAGR